MELLPRLILHWDGRFGSALGLDGTEGSAEKNVTVDRVAVVVTGEAVKMLLGVPKAIDGSRREMAAVVNKIITSLDIL